MHNVQFEFSVNDNNSFIIDIDESNNPSANHLNLGYYDTSKIDWPLVNEYLSTADWVALFNGNNSIDICWDLFYSTIVYAISLYAPPKRDTTTNKRCRPKSEKLLVYKSYPKRINKLRNKKANSWRRYKAKPSLRRKATYQKHSNLYKRELNNHITSVENRLVRSNNCRLFFIYANKK